MDVLDVNGHDFYELRNAFEQAKQVKDKPTMLLPIQSRVKVFLIWKITMHGMELHQMMNNMKRQ